VDGQRITANYFGVFGAVPLFGRGFTAADDVPGGPRGVMLGATLWPQRFGANRAIIEAARKGDVACGQALPRDLGDWRAAVEFVLGPFGCGKELAEVSAVDFAKSAERDVDAFCRQGFGTLLASLAQGVPVELSTPATAIDLRRSVEVETPKGTIVARAAIVTASINVIASGAIKFTPGLPARQLEAMASDMGMARCKCV
jgi:glycine/D-amino acid oxidase-like deaminating enzyme